MSESAIYLTNSGDEMPTVNYAVANGQENNKRPPVEILTINYGSYGASSYWTNDFYRAMKGRARTSSHVNSGTGRYLIRTCLLYSMTTNQILVLGVGWTNPEQEVPRFGSRELLPEKVYVSNTFDTPKCGYQHKSMRKHWRKVMYELMEMGIRIEKVSPSVINGFKVKFDWSPSLKGLNGFLDRGLGEAIRTS